MDLDPLRQLAARWARQDPDPDTRATVRRWLDDGDVDALRRAFERPLTFGTAGLRGPLAPGPAGMNRLTVRRTTAGLARVLLAHADDAADRGVVVGFDGRHGSATFARDTAEVLAAAGIEVWLAGEVTPTPLVAYAVRHLDAAAGVVVTASHNPPGDNGYKVFWSDGAQIVPPWDERIAAAAQAVDDLPAPGAGEAIAARIRPLRPTVGEAWLRDAAGLRVRRPAGIRVVHTALHGVGAPWVERLLGEAGHTVVPVQAQREPDGSFPTVAFPNPEEPGALDLAMAQADTSDAALVLANDPDADRLAAAVRDGSGRWTPLTGNQIGVLLADELLSHPVDDRPALVATTIVSTRMLEAVARHHGAFHDETLTGFKWLGRLGAAHEREGGRFVLGFEEALGYSVGGLVRDKDGVSAALLLADLAAALHAEGRTLRHRLVDLWRRHGVHAAIQRSVRHEGLDGPERMAAAVGALRAAPPTTLAGRPVLAVDDLSTGLRTHADGTTRRLSLPGSNVLGFTLEGGRVLVRPSGTEPKLKLYAEAVLPAGDDAWATHAEALALAGRWCDALGDGGADGAAAG